MTHSRVGKNHQHHKSSLKWENNINKDLQFYTRESYSFVEINYYQEQIVQSMIHDIQTNKTKHWDINNVTCKHE